MMLFLSSSAQFAATQASGDPTTLSYQAFSQLKNVYRSGGQADDLVAKLNSALRMVQEARIKRAQGDISGGNRLEAEAAVTIQSVLAAIPTVNEEATRESNARTLTALGLIPVVVALSTFAFYAALRTWRYYEKMKLYEMRIVEKKTED